MASAGNEQRAVRGTAVCLQAARFNHGAPACAPVGSSVDGALTQRPPLLLGCFPNVARFDYFDADRQDRMMLHFRVRTTCVTGQCRRSLNGFDAQAIDPIPAGVELLISYFPVTLSRTERRLRLLDEYGFDCR